MSTPAAALSDQIERKQPTLFTTPASRRGFVVRVHWLIVAAILAIGAVWQFMHPTSADVSWNIVLGEKILAGGKLYRDIVEVNPPMSIFLYLPAVVIDHLTTIPSEAIVTVITLALVAYALALTAHLMTLSGRAMEVPRAVVAAACLLAIVPMYVFAEREHIAVTLLLPALALMVMRAEQRALDGLAVVLVGLGNGLVVTIKPHFGLAILLPMIAIAIRQRSWRVIFVRENLIAATVVMAYAAVVVVFFRAYLTDMLPMLADTYRVVRETPMQLAATNLGFMIVAATLVVAAAVLGRDLRQPKIFVPGLAAIGLLLAFLEQGKGWLYHLYPAMTIAFLILCSDALYKTLTGFKFDVRRLAALVFIGLAFKGLYMIVLVMEKRDAFETSLAPYVARHFDHPRLLSLGRSLGIGQPLTRMVGGVWVGHTAMAYIPEAVAFAAAMPDADPALRNRLDHWIARDRAFLARDLREGRPDLILLDRKTYPYDALIAENGEAASRLSHYRLLTTIDGIDLLVPSSDAETARLTVSGDPRTD